MVLEIEVQGARQVREAMPEAVQVFIAPPSPDDLRERLEGRGTDQPEEIERRLAVAERGAGRARASSATWSSTTTSSGRRDELVALVRAIVQPGCRLRALRSRRQAWRQTPCRGFRGVAEASARIGPTGRTDRSNPLIYPRIDSLLEHVDSHYAAVIVAAKRARQINNYYHTLGEGVFEEFPPPMVETPSKNYLTIALEEVAQGKIKSRYRV